MSNCHNHRHRRPCIAAAAATLPLLLLLLCINTELVQTSEEALPSIWDAISEENKTYHIVYILELPDYKMTLTVEEWASLESGKFRLDLVATAGTVSYLAHYATSELYRYKPFTCDQLSGSKSTKDLELLSKFFLGYDIKPSNSKPLDVYGLGPLWLHAMANSQGVTMERAPVQDASDEEQEEDGNPDDSSRTQQAAAAFAVDYDNYLVKLAGDQPFELKFYFPAGDARRKFVEKIEWVTVGAAESGQNASEAVQAHARLVEFDAEPFDELEVFGLPLGYGCVRDAHFETPLDLDIGLVLLHQGVSNQVALQVTTSMPRDELLRSWISRRYNIRLMRQTRGRVGDSVSEVESFFVSQLQELDELSGRLRKTRKIWWSSSQEAANMRALVYTIDENRQRCKVSHEPIRNLIKLEFPLITDSPSQLKSGPQLKPMVLSVDQISMLFSDNSLYHLLRGSSVELKNGKFIREALLERRVLSFKLNGPDGSLVWAGPVSIVKEMKVYQQCELNQRAHKNSTIEDVRGAPKEYKCRCHNLTMMQDYRVKISIFFLSPSMDQIYYKTVIELVDNHPVGLDYVHQQLDVSQCLPAESQREIIIKYPTISPKFIPQLRDQRQQLMKIQLYTQLFNELGLTPLQLTSFRFDFDLFYMRLRTRVLELPLTHVFEMRQGSCLMMAPNRSDGGALIEMSASSAEYCAGHCEHYNCMRFSFNANTRLCQVELLYLKAAVATKEPSCELYSYVRRSKAYLWTQIASVDDMASGGNQELEQSASVGGRPHYTARATIELLQGFLWDWLSEETSSSFNATNNPLVMRIEMDLLTSPGSSSSSVQAGGERQQPTRKSILELRPVALESDLDTMNEFARQLDGQGADQEVAIRTNAQQFRIEYLLRFEGRAFRNDVGELVGDRVTFEECAGACENDDCRSFSYCEADNSCRLTQFHTDAYILRYSEERKCNIHSLDYLSKFENYGRVSTAPQKGSSIESARSPRDCASICVDTRDSCQGFYFCIQSKQTNEAGQPVGTSSGANFCYLVSRHINDLRSPEERLFLQPKATVINNDTNNLSEAERNLDCSYYSRSYLAQFDQFHGKSIEITQDGGDKRVLKSNSGDSNYCARRCIETNCVAFDVCPAVGSKFFRQTCQFAGQQLSRSQIVPKRRCTTFVLSDKSQFNKLHAKIIKEEAGKRKDGLLKPDKEAALGGRVPADQSLPGPEGENENKTESGEDISGPALELLDSLGEQYSAIEALKSGASSHWFGHFVSLVAGSLLGVALIQIWNELYARGWLDDLGHRLALPGGLPRFRN